MIFVENYDDFIKNLFDWKIVKPFNFSIRDPISLSVETHLINAFCTVDTLD